MFDRLIDILFEIWEKIVPFVVVRQYLKGVRLRFGISKGVVEPGFHWKIPLVDEILEHSIVWTTLPLPVQSITTKDDQTIVIKGLIKYRVIDIEHFLLGVWDAKDAMADMTCGIIRDIVEERTWEECKDKELSKKITIKAKKEAENWGLEISTVTLTDKGKIRSIRLFNEHDHII